jgi:hypothetical protein
MALFCYCPGVSSRPHNSWKRLLNRAPLAALEFDILAKLVDLERESPVEFDLVLPIVAGRHTVAVTGLEGWMYMKNTPQIRGVLVRDTVLAVWPTARVAALPEHYNGFDP